MKLRFVLFALLTLALLAAVSIPAPAKAAPYPRVPCSYWGYLDAPKPVLATLPVPYAGGVAIYGFYNGRTTYSVTVADKLGYALIPNGTPVTFTCGGKPCGKSSWIQGSNLHIDLKVVPSAPVFTRPPAAPMR